MWSLVTARRATSVAIATSIALLLLLDQGSCFRQQYRRTVNIAMMGKKKGGKSSTSTAKPRQQKGSSSPSKLRVGDDSGSESDPARDLGLPRLVVMDLDYTLWCV